MLVSVVMPTFKHHEYIKTSIKSILEQTHEDIELIIVPVYGDKKTFSIINKFKDKRIKVVGSNYAFITHQMNLGGFLARGEYFMFFASDDFLYKDSVSELLRFAQSHDAVIAYPDFYIGNKSLEIKRLEEKPDYNPRISQEKSSYMVDVSLVKTKEFLKYFPLRFMDRKARLRRIWIKMSANKSYKKRIFRYPKPTFIYRQHENSVHLHGSQSSFKNVVVGENDELKMFYKDIKKMSIKKLSKLHFTVYIPDPNVYWRNVSKFKWKRVIVHWCKQNIDDIRKEKMDRIYSITHDRDVMSILERENVPNIRFIESKNDFIKYIQEDEYI